MTLDAHADLVLTGGRVATMDAARRWASAIAVRDGRIVAVGVGHGGPARDRAADPGHRAARPDRHAGLPGRARAPGRRPASRCCACDLARAPRPRRVPADHRGVRAVASDEPWIRGGGWYMAAFERGAPRREDLDRIVPDRPAFLSSRDGHSAWVNTRALELAGVTADDPGSGRRPDRARPRRHAERHAPRRRDGPRRAPCPGGHAGRARRGAAARPAPPPQPRHHRLAGRHRRAATGGARLRRARVDAAS